MIEKIIYYVGKLSLRMRRVSFKLRKSFCEWLNKEFGGKWGIGLFILYVLYVNFCWLVVKNYLKYLFYFEFFVFIYLIFCEKMIFVLIYYCYKINVIEIKVIINMVGMYVG